MDSPQQKSVQCPYCWERFNIEVDPSVDRQEYVEDCYVCCQPILLTVRVSDQRHIQVSAKKENE